MDVAHQSTTTSPTEGAAILSMTYAVLGRSDDMRKPVSMKPLSSFGTRPGGARRGSSAQAQGWGARKQRCSRPGPPSTKMTDLIVHTNSLHYYIFLPRKFQNFSRPSGVRVTVPVVSGEHSNQDQICLIKIL